jgi:hypothetical protein
MQRSIKARGNTHITDLLPAGHLLFARMPDSVDPLDPIQFSQASLESSELRSGFR